MCRVRRRAYGGRSGWRVRCGGTCRRCGREGGGLGGAEATRSAYYARAFHGRYSIRHQPGRGGGVVPGQFPYGSCRRGLGTNVVWASRWQTWWSGLEGAAVRQSVSFIAERARLGWGAPASRFVSVVSQSTQGMQNPLRVSRGPSDQALEGRLARFASNCPGERCSEAAERGRHRRCGPRRRDPIYGRIRRLDQQYEETDAGPMGYAAASTTPPWSRLGIISNGPVLMGADMRSYGVPQVMLAAKAGR